MTGFRDISACVFDAYGTLLDVHSAVQRCRAEIGPAADALAVTWRSRQLEYTWLRSLMGRYADFWQVTGEALDYALAAHGIENPGLRAHLMELYLRLDAFPDARPALAALHGRGIRTAILSNGSPTMLAAVLDSSKLRPNLDLVLSVDPLHIYKPHPSVYQLACDKLGLDRQKILFVSANGWDVAGAAVFGLRVAWINRTGQKPERLPAGPGVEMRSLEELTALVGQ